ncbi:MAG: hypothetical protein RI562_04530 [Salibacter sp.]|uniref:IS1/IS1595 family N-terminal zinc-binding domain-containing protein n=1 Tax=Salibacter sp. TaxID=2010995 RepID=UPI0028702CF2|nr:hypothetical protein [Salibacter sp.]MDR9398306.1 hypothetical protein [Salibacter sp.]
MKIPKCPKCKSEQVVKSGVVKNRQRYKCKNCFYHFTVDKLGKKIDDYFVVKSLQLYLEGVSYREIERLLGVSHVSVMNWVKHFGVKRPVDYDYHPTYKILSQNELSDYLSNPENTNGKGFLITEVGDKFMIIRWDRFRDQ